MKKEGKERPKIYICFYVQHWAKSMRLSPKCYLTTASSLMFSISSQAFSLGTGLVDDLRSSSSSESASAVLGSALTCLTPSSYMMVHLHPPTSSAPPRDLVREGPRLLPFFGSARQGKSLPIQHDHNRARYVMARLSQVTSRQETKPDGNLHR